MPISISRLDNPSDNSDSSDEREQERIKQKAGYNGFRMTMFDEDGRFGVFGFVCLREEAARLFVFGGQTSGPTAVVVDLDEEDDVTEGVVDGEDDLSGRGWG